jgi:glycosyltransferase involved in cell wall biosynthesis
MRPVVFTGDIFRQQPRGGITRYVLEVTVRLRREAEVVLGLHQSEDPGLKDVRTRWALRLPAVRGMHYLTGAAGRLVDTLLLVPRRGVIVHPTYYRDPAGLPRGQPLVVTVHDMTHERLARLFPRDGRSDGDPARHKAALCARADRLLCYSEATRRDIVEFLRLPGDRIRVVPLASREWSAVVPIPLEVSRPFLLWVGERHVYKNFIPTLSALAACRAAADCELLCAGGGPLRPAERAALEATGLARRMRRRNLSDGELRWAYEHATGLLYPSLWEGFGLPVVEALALGCPVLTSDRASLPELAGAAAIVVDPEDPDALRDGIARLVASGRAADALEARRRQAARFSWDACAALHESTYQELDA